MQDGLLTRPLPHLCDGLTRFYAVPLSDSQLAVVTICTQIHFAVFHDNKLTVADKSTAAVDDFSFCGSANRLSEAAGNVDTLAAQRAAPESRL